jgi:hypothetical protein
MIPPSVKPICLRQMCALRLTGELKRLTTSKTAVLLAVRMVGQYGVVYAARRALPRRRWIEHV